MVELTNTEINELLQEPKSWPGRRKINLEKEAGHKRADKDLITESKHKFRVFIRQNTRDPLDFSIGLVYKENSTGELIRLLRCNGPSHIHPNKIEREEITFDFHIHKATERYMSAGKKADSWAYITNEYNDIETAIACFAQLINLQPIPFVETEPTTLPSLFE